MIVLDKLLVKGVWWVFRRVTDAVDGEMHDESTLREELLAAEMRLELGELDEAEFRAIENDILGRMREIRSRRAPEAEAPAGTRYEVESIEADLGEESNAPSATRPPYKRAH